MREDPDHGLFLQSVNGVVGGGQAQTYWELLSAGVPGEPAAQLDVGEYQCSYGRIVVAMRTSPQRARVIAGLNEPMVASSEDFFNRERRGGLMMGVLS